MAKIAYLFGVSEYESWLDPLPAAVKDVDAMEIVLRDPQIGGFDEVEAFRNLGSGEIRDRMETLFTNRQADDLVLLYFSGHGMTDMMGRFYFMAKDTEANQQSRFGKAKAIDAQFVHDLMENCNSQRVVVILDCCHSGAFVRRDGDGIDFEKQLGGRGRIVLTASAATKYSFEQEGEELAIYTRYLVKGLRTGAADRDGDGYVYVNELHDYVVEQLQTAASGMSPQRYVVKGDGEKIRLAKVAVPDPERNYRKLVKKNSQTGEILTPERWILDQERDRLESYGLTSARADEIENEVLEPYRQRHRNRTIYQKMLQDCLQYDDLVSRNHAFKVVHDQVEPKLQLSLADMEAIRLAVLGSKTLPKTVLPPVQPAQSRLEPIPKPVESRPIKSSPKVTPQNSRRRFLQSAGLSGAALFSAVIINQLKQWFDRPNQSSPLNPAKEITKTSSLALDPVKETARTSLGLPKQIFEVITLNAKAEPESRKQCEAEILTQDLGNAVSLKMVAISAGSFMMGSPENEKGRSSYEGPQHEVKVSAFFMGQTQVTQGQWKAVAKLPKVKQDLLEDPSKFKGTDRPVENVSWDDAIEFCDRLSAKTGKRYGLPSEAQWEYACRAGTTMPFYFGETISTDVANYNGNYTYEEGRKGNYRRETMAVGKFPPNSFGLYDMHGNIWEWCADPWHDSYKNAPIDGSIWKTKPSNDSYRLLRGGSWVNNPSGCRSAYRGRNERVNRNDDVGFRLLLLPSPQDS
jgi:formylglycine-generating enzyme required for sulfatase activity